MQFLKTLFWALLIGLAGAFAYNNWLPVPLRLWGGLIAEVNLPLLLLVTFLLGLAPMLLAYHAMRWRLRQRLASTERALNDLRAVQPDPAPATAPESTAPEKAGPEKAGPLFDSTSSAQKP